MITDPSPLPQPLPGPPPYLPRAARPASSLALALGVSAALASHCAAAQTTAAPPTVEELARRLQALEQRYGTGDAASAPTTPAADANRALDQRLRILERRLELADAAAAAKAASTPTVTASPQQGLSVKSPAGDAEVKLRTLVQLDGRFFTGDDAVPQNDGFLLRRVRPTLEGTLGTWLGFRLTPEFAGDSATLLDAYIDLKFDPRATLRLGKFTAPVGLERLQSASSNALQELGLPTELVPNREIGVQLQGEFAGSTLNYAIGIYNGTVDGRDAVTSNPDDDLEVAARVFVEPWKNSGGALAGLGFGIAGTQGDKHGVGNNYLPRYRTPGQVQFFNYRTAIAADGAQTRWSPQAWYYRNTLGLLAEYVSSEQEVLNPASGARAALDNRAWQVVGSVVLTGEDASYRGVIAPNHPFTPGAAGWGAFEVAARYGTLDIDDAAFPLFADPNAVASSARSWGVGLNWYLTANFKLVANYTQTRFEDGISGGDREDEKALFTRAQFSF
ncbi:MAG: OprO/OprP family phosphate-selective porin [Luteimonas sp.]